MNRIASLAMATVTTALVGASISAVSASQGLFAFGGSGTDESAASSDWTETPTATAEAATPASEDVAATETPQTTYVYVDSPPVIVTKEIVVPVPVSKNAPVDVVASSLPEVPGASASEPTAADPGSPTPAEQPTPSNGNSPSGPTAVAPAPVAPSGPVFAPPPKSSGSRPFLRCPTTSGISVTDAVRSDGDPEPHNCAACYRPTIADGLGRVWGRTRT